MEINVEEIICGCLQLYLSRKFPQNKPKLWNLFETFWVDKCKYNFSRIRRVTELTLLWSYKLFYMFYIVYRYLMFFKWPRITLFWGNFEPPKICLWKDFNFSHVWILQNYGQSLSMQNTLLKSLVGVWHLRTYRKCWLAWYLIGFHQLRWPSILFTLLKYFIKWLIYGQNWHCS